jgi:CBS domain-containing protein
MNRSEASAWLKSLPPFNRLEKDEFEEVIDVLTVGDLAAGETILKRWDSPTHFYVVRRGIVEELDNAGVVARYETGDAFDAKALVEGRGENMFVARGACSCFLIPAGFFMMLLKTKRDVRRFFCEDLVRKRDAILRVHERREAASLLMASISQAKLQPPVFLERETSLTEAMATMNAQEISAVLVQHNAGTGIFTKEDYREKVHLSGMTDAIAIGDVANSNLITLSPDDSLFMALQAMTAHSIRHVVITRGGAIEGIFEQVDLLNHLSGTANLITNRINRAASCEDLKQAGREIPHLINTFAERGVKTRYIARLVTRLNRKIFRRLFDELVPENIRNSSCFIAMGSEGRGEQLLKTDQDNGLILRDDLPWDAIEPVTTAITEALADLGYPPCEGNVMVSNPVWTKSVTAYQQDLDRWIHHPDETAFNHLAVFFDASCVAGDPSLLDGLRSHLFNLLENQSVVLGHIAKPILGYKVPLGLFHRLVTEKEGPHVGKLDIKKGGIFPAIHGVRCLALEQGIVETNTLDRLHALSARGMFTGGQTADLIESLDAMSALRLKAQMTQLEGGQPCDNYIAPGKLNNEERDLLRSSFKIVKEFKGFVRDHFKLNLVA